MKTIFALGVIALSCFAQETLPEGKAKPIVERVCSKCHGLEGIVRARMTKERWSAVVDDMIGRGAQASDDEIDQMIEYLAANFGTKAPAAKPDAKPSR